MSEELYTANNQRIAKNTLLLYFRMLFMMAVSLYTSRVVLNTLGIEDFGIYSVVGGITTMFSFLNSAMSSSTQRYMTFALGKGEILQLRKVFQMSLNIHWLIALLMLILGETIGLWFLKEKMVIPLERQDAAFWVYQFSVATMIIMIISVPYNAAIIAHEKMSAFAYISVMEVLLRLGIVYLLYFTRSDKLIFYVALLFATQLLLRIIYGFYCKQNFEETHYEWRWDKNLFKEMLGFAGWNLWGGLAGVFFTQGLNILLNIFFGPAVNAARGIAVLVQGAVAQFSSNFQTALNPQITKSYAKGDLVYMRSLIFRSSKFSFLLLATISFPIFIQADILLSTWLGVVPDYTVTFVRLMLCITVIDAMAGAFMVAAQSTGRIRIYQSVIGGILLAIVPVSYIVLKLGAAPWSVFLVHLCICIIAFIVRLYIVHSMICLSLRSYLCEVLLRCLWVSLLAMPLPFLLLNVLPDTLFSGALIGIVSIMAMVFFSYTVGLTVNEKKFVAEKIAVWRKK